MTDDLNGHRRRYIFQWHPLPQPPWAGSEIGAFNNAVKVLMDMEDYVGDEYDAEQFVHAHGEVVEVEE